MAQTDLTELKVCRWISDEDGVYDTSCDNRFEFESDGPKVNGFKFCPYCGNKLKEVLRERD